MLPTGAASLVFLLGDVVLSGWAPDGEDNPFRWSRGILHGPQARYYTAGPKPPVVSVGVALRSGAVAPMVGLPACEIVDQHVPLDELWGNRAATIAERLHAATGPNEAFAVLEAELRARLTRPLLMHPAVAHAIARLETGSSRTRISELREEVGYSSRHFIALFRSAIGLTPIQYSRIRRFAAVLRSLTQSGRSDLADLAIATGYTDQSHLNRDFREFSGTTPLLYRPRDAGSPHHHSLAPANPEHR